jgi:hypothetical protein
MRRLIVASVVMVVLLVVSAGLALAADQTGASLAMDGVGNSASAWAARILLIGFISTIAWLALSRLFGMASIVAVPIVFIIIGGLLAAGPILLAPFMVAGQTLR